MNTWIQKLHDSKTHSEFVDVLNEIRKATEANPAEMLKELEAADSAAEIAENHAREFYDFAYDDVRREPTVENKAYAWDAYWEHSSAYQIAEAIRSCYNDAAFYVEFPEEAERMKNEQAAALAAAQASAQADPFPF